MIATIGPSEISLIVSGLAAIGSIVAVVITYRLGVQRFGHERELADLDAVRVVLDDAAGSLQQANSAVSAVTTHIDAYANVPPGTLWNDSLLRDDAGTLEKARAELDASAGRLRMRFGADHELVIVHESASTLALEAAYRVELIGQEFQDPKAAVASEKNRINRIAKEIDLARESFTLIAYRVAGVKLPATPLTGSRRPVFQAAPFRTGGAVPIVGMDGG